MPIFTTLGAACAKAWGFTSGLITDQYFNLVSLLLPGNGTNGAQNNTFLDASTNNFTITRNGNTTQGTFSPFSQTGWGNYFNGSTDWLTTGSSVAALGSGNWTVEFWVYPTTSGTDRIISDARTSSQGLQPTFYLNSANNIVFYINATNVLTSSSTVSANVWTHIAFVKNSSTTTCYINGTATGTYSDSNTYLGNVTTFGASGLTADSHSGKLTGYISNYRSVVGRAVYTSAFDPPTTPLTRTTGGTNPPQGTETSLLICQSNRFLDSNGPNTPASSPITITPSGSPSVQAFSPFNPTASWTAANNGGSGYFDGTGDYLTAPSNIVDFAAGQAFTVECWVYVSSNTPGQAISANGANAFSFVISGGQVLYGKSGVVDILVGTMAAANQWVHVAVGRNSSNTSRLWVNGTSVATSGSDTYSFNAATMYIGSNSTPTAYLNGYMAGLRVVKGSDVYGVANTSITVPTAPLTAITNTQLLLNFTNAGIYDATSKNDLETVGNAQISTAQSKWGGGSIAFDGTGDYLYEPSNQNFSFGTGDFTIEFWLYMNAVTGTQVVYDNRPANGAYPTIYLVGAVIYYYTNSGQRITGSTLSTGVWYHIAVARSGTNTRLFVNGTQSGSTYTDSTNYLAGPLVVASDIAGGTPANFANCYIDDLRVTKGVARYTANFTAPTAPFPVQ